MRKKMMFLVMGFCLMVMAFGCASQTAKVSTPEGGNVYSHSDNGIFLRSSAIETATAQAIVEQAYASRRQGVARAKLIESYVTNPGSYNVNAVRAMTGARIGDDNRRQASYDIVVHNISRHVLRIGVNDIEMSGHIPPGGYVAYQIKEKKFRMTSYTVNTKTGAQMPYKETTKRINPKKGKTSFIDGQSYDFVLHIS